MVKEKGKPLYVQLSERDDLADFLRLIPSWIWGAIIWYAFSKLVIDSLSKGKPGTELNAVLLGADIVTNLPAGVSLAAQIDVFLTGLQITEGLTMPSLTDVFFGQWGRFVGPAAPFAEAWQKWFTEADK